MRRHSPVLTAFDPRSPLSVGNGEFAFTADCTGLQTFPELYEKAMPLCTQSQWGWHTVPHPGFAPEQLRLETFDTHGRPVGYPTSSTGQKELFNWLRENPHRLHLGRIALELTRADGSSARPEEIRSIRQQLHLWTGALESHFEWDGAAVAVWTCVHPTRDALSVRVESALVQQGRAAILLAFPYGSPEITAANWAAPERHQSEWKAVSAEESVIERRLDGDRYWVHVHSSGRVQPQQAHYFRISAAQPRVDACFEFTAHPSIQPLVTGTETREAAARHWPRFWSSGAAVSLEGSTAEGAEELERRIVLSQYLTAIQCAGSLPPQETGLTCNSWYGKYHLEMHWWHAAHFALWDRAPLLERSLDWYLQILPQAKAWAKQQGYSGARWPKMTAPDGRDSPSGIGPLLIWQQPHPIALAELCYRANPSKAALQKWSPLVFATAEFLSSFAFYEEARQRYVLGPPVIPAQENHPPRETWNPTFELQYFADALEWAQQWRERLGLRREEKWERVRRGLSRLPEKHGVYLAHENCPQTFTQRQHDHPSMLAALGMLSGSKADLATMLRTLQRVMEVWDWPSTWGWDYPMVAMTAARLNQPELALQALLMKTPKNEWLPNGHNYQRGNLPLYLPGNGGLLAAVAMMAAGWQGGPQAPAPGFPKQGWSVHAENFRIRL